MENKQRICDLLALTLRETENLYDLVDLRYQKDGYDEIVVAEFENGSRKIANVAMDSGTAMIKDIVSSIV